MHRHKLSPTRRIAVQLSAAMLALVAVSSCSLPRPWSASTALEPQAFTKAVTEPGTLTINVHVPDDGSIDGTDLYLAFDRITDDRDHLPRDLEAPLAVYCKSGTMSGIAVAALKRLGYRDIVELQGGMDEWARQGLPLRRPA